MEDWKECAPGTEWSSVRSTWPCLPYRWGQKKEDVIYLKDTCGTFYKNELLEGGNRYRYELPRSPKEYEREVIQELKKGEGSNVLVKLYAVRNARDHYLGEWTPVSFQSGDRKDAVYLSRLQTQTGEEELSKEERTHRRRSTSERRHGDLLVNLLEGWTVIHEPESATRLDMPFIERGQLSPWSSDEYTVDFVAARGFFRICFESKCDLSSVDEVCLRKCRALRDGSYTRVFVLSGHGPEETTFLDMGPAFTPPEEERRLSLDEFKTLVTSMRCSPETRPCSPEGL